MARLYYGVGRGFYSKSGFASGIPHYEVDFIRPPFSVAESQFIRDTGAENNTPMPFSNEGTFEDTVLEDAALNLSAYYQRLEDIGAYLRAHDAIELYDLKSELSAWVLVEEDLLSFLAAYYESMDDIGSNLSTWATGYKNLSGNYDAKGQKIEALIAYLTVAKEKFRNLAMCLTAASGDILRDMATFLAATDGDILKDFGTCLHAIGAVSAFRSVTAHRVSSVIHEVS